MGRTPGTSNVTPAEVKLIKSLFRQGLKITEIVEVTERSESVVMRAVRGIKRKRPARVRDDNSKRDDRILRLIEKGLTRAEVGKRVGLKASRVGDIVVAHPHVAWLLRVRKLKPATVAKRYRLELSTVDRIVKGGTRKTVKRSFVRVW